MKENQIKESKKQIQSLADKCIQKLYENKFLNSQKERYINQINFIKSILNNNSKFENTEASIKNMILIDQIKNFYNSLITSNLELKKEEQKLLTKLNSYKDEVINVDSVNRQILANLQYDNLLLICNLKEKNDTYKLLYKAYEGLKQYFKENKRETYVNNKWGEYFLKVNLNDLSEKMMAECQYFIQFKNKCEKKEKEKNKISKKIKLYNDIIKFYKKFIGENEEFFNINNYNNNNKNIANNKNNKNKNTKKLLAKSIFLQDDNKLSLFDNKDSFFDENLLIDQEKNIIDKRYKNVINNEQKQEKEQQGQLDYCSFIGNNNYDKLFKYKSHEINSAFINNKNINKNFKKSSKSIKNFLTVDDLFDVNNHEGKEEAIIDEELHSDDEATFEIKVKPLKKITIHYIPKIKKQVPKINLSQIEFNKQKVINEADLYSLQRRKFKMQNLDENIKMMKKKIKKLKHICKVNKKKISAFENYSKNMENNYKVLKPLKIQSSVSGVKIPKIQTFFKDDDKNNNFTGIYDIDLEDDYNDNLEDEDIYNTETTNAGSRAYISDKSNIIVHKKYSENLINKDKDSGKKINHYNKASARANSK